MKHSFSATKIPFGFKGSCLCGWNKEITGISDLFTRKKLFLYYEEHVEKAKFCIHLFVTYFRLDENTSRWIPQIECMRCGFTYFEPAHTLEENLI